MFNLITIFIYFKLKILLNIYSNGKYKIIEEKKDGMCLHVLFIEMVTHKVSCFFIVSF